MKKCVRTVIMKKQIIIILLLFLATICEAQSKYCLSYLDYLTDVWYPLEQMEFEYRSGTKSLFWGGSNYKPLTGNKETDKLLKKKARFLMHNDSLYVNCRGLSIKGLQFGNWYSPACVYNKDAFLFIALSEKSKSNTAGAALMFGMIGGAITASANDKKYQCYILTPTSSEDAIIKPIDENYMLTLLEGHDGLLSEYQAITEKKKRYSPDVVIPILKKLGLVK